MENKDFEWDERNAAPSRDRLHSHSSCFLSLARGGLAWLRKAGPRPLAPLLGREMAEARTETFLFYCATFH